MEIVKVRNQAYGTDIVLSIPKHMRSIFSNASHATVEETPEGILYKPIAPSGASVAKPNPASAENKHTQAIRRSGIHV